MPWYNTNHNSWHLAPRGEAVVTEQVRTVSLISPYLHLKNLLWPLISQYLVSLPGRLRVIRAQAATT
jgi:hypothetical protein